MGQNLLIGLARRLSTAHVAASGGSTVRGPIGHRSAQLAQHTWRHHRPAVTRPAEFIPDS
jgi:hypothetical protein